MIEPDLTLRSSTGREITAPMTLWVKCLMEMLPPAQLQELARRVEEHQDRVVIPGVRKNYRMIAEPGAFGVKR